jgi:outer membrane protein OmpA-like peptidoglycan-associated protein
MKIARPSTLIAVALMALSLGVIGCKKNPQKPTTLLGQGPGRGLTGDQPGGIINSAPVNPAGGQVNPETPGGTALGDPKQGIPAAVGDWEKWFADPKEFKDQTVYFDFDKANVKPSEVGKLKEVARRMKGFHGKALRIEGHCDERGTEEYNRALGDKRAQSIREFLASEGFDPTMMTSPSTPATTKRPMPKTAVASWSSCRRLPRIKVRFGILGEALRREDMGAR